MAKSKGVSLSGSISQLIYSPKGGIEGVLLRTDKEEVQLVLDKEDTGTSARLSALGYGAALKAQVQPEPPSEKGPSVHPLYRLLALETGGGKTLEPHATAGAFTGKVARFNYARHGEANGVVLDTGDFIHTRPGGMRQLGLKIGSKVSAQGQAQPLLYSAGMVVEADTVNGVAIGKGKAKKAVKKAARKVVKKAAKKVVKKAIKKVS